MNAQALKCEYHRSQTRPLDFWNCILGHALLPEFPGVDSKTFPSWGPSSSARSLLSLAPNHRKSPPKRIQPKSLLASSLDGARPCVCVCVLCVCVYVCVCVCASRKITLTDIFFAGSQWRITQSETHFEMGTTSKISMLTLELWLSCFTKPLSMMYL